jgi:hypothetical protein
MAVWSTTCPYSNQLSVPNRLSADILPLSKGLVYFPLLAATASRICLRVSALEGIAAAMPGQTQPGLLVALAAQPIVLQLQRVITKIEQPPTSARSAAAHAQPKVRPASADQGSAV